MAVGAFSSFPSSDGPLQQALLTVVIVDDSKSALSYMSDLVSELRGAEAVAFLSSLAALSWLERNPADLVVVDYMMPPPDGLAFIKAFRKDPVCKSVPIIMVTSSDLREVRYMALQLGVTDFLTKPVDPVEFIARTGNALESYRAHKILANQSVWLAGEVARATAALVENEREALLFLARSAEHRDPETGNHLARMSSYSRLISVALGLPPEQTMMIESASPLHDVGKVAIPDSILRKPGKLTPEEWSVMQGHAQHGGAILSGSKSPLLQLACEIALTHHEKFDGSGYPRGLQGMDIPLAGRIVAVADVFDALTTVRPYKPAWSFEEACSYLSDNQGTHFDSACVEAFMSASDEIKVVFCAHVDNFIN